MEKEQRSKLQKATQEARRLLEEEFSRQLLETYDINVAAGRWSEDPGAHLQTDQRLLREKLLAWIEHRSAQINDEKEALLLALREMAFTALNRFVALKLMEARELVRPCVSGGLESEGFQEFTAVAQGLLVEQESSYRLYLETIFEDVSRELRALFDPRDPASLLWPKRTALLDLLDILNRPELAELWREDETLGWIYQYFNGDAERKKMREESSAPRNSRELAVRNQFFTPRYVVEFLTDNTLGRIWYEMRQGDTGLKERCRYLVRRPNEIWLQPGEEASAEVVADEALSQEELLRQPVHIPYRPLKDPREIRMLDPACGSMHFGLYAFDLYLAIYAEAWEIAQGSDEQAKQGEAFAAFVAYAAGFADKAAFLREVPRLILQHNIHGVDIDPRATQIARLTLWLRAQRAWQEQGVEVAARPAITRSNVVCAEPMPGERELLADFVDQQFPEAERGLVQQLLETIFDKMQLAGEAGSLLKIEEEIRDSIEQARREWQKLATQQRDLFSAAELAELGGVGSTLNTDLQNLTKDFWVDIEERIYDALREYAYQAESGGGFQRRLFAEDAAQGFAFIDVCRKRYDIAVMNPPFGKCSDTSDAYFRRDYPSNWKELYAAFFERSLRLIIPNGSVASISSSQFLYTKQMQDLRSALMSTNAVEFFVELGLGVLDGATVDTALSVFSPEAKPSNRETLYLDLSDIELSDKPSTLLNATEQTDIFKRFALAKFASLETSPFCFHAAPELLSLWSQPDRFDPEIGRVATGNHTFDDYRFLRLRWEVSPTQIAKEWIGYEKGGEYQPFCSPTPLVVNWSHEGSELRTINRQRNGTEAQVMQSSSLWFRSGICYSHVSSVAFGPRVLPEGHIFSSESISLFPRQPEARATLLGLLCSTITQDLIWCYGRYRKIENRAVSNLPFSSALMASLDPRIGDITIQSIKEVQSIERMDEVSPYFVSCISSQGSLCSAMEVSRKTNNALKVLCDELDGLSESALFAGCKVPEPQAGRRRELTDAFVFRSLRSQADFSGSVISQALGCAFGRWDIRYLTGEQAAPELSDPFEPLPVCAPGQLQNMLSLPARPDEIPSEYRIRIPWDGILVDDPTHHLDLEIRIREVIEIVWSGNDGRSTAEAIEHEACENLGVQSLRDYFRKPTCFFADHLRRYSESRRQAPICWAISAGGSRYSVWLYYHRFTQDTLYRVLRDFVEPRIQEAEREQFELESQGGLSGDAASLLQEAQALLQDLQLFKGELELVAPLWNPNLNDGVIINHAILWRITPYTPWQNKCKECWDKLVKGDYDWAHLAFYLWPERVIRKCTTDRSLAIAHGLEERLWQETNNGNWLQRQVSEAELQALLAEYSKPAVQNALERFLAASPPVAAARTRTPRAAKSSSTGSTRRPRGSASAVDTETSRQTLLVLTAAPADGLGRNAIAELLGVEAASLTAVIKQLKEGGRIEQLGAARGAKYRLTESGLAAVESQAGEDN